MNQLLPNPTSQYSTAQAPHLTLLQTLYLGLWFFVPDMFSASVSMGAVPGSLHLYDRSVRNGTTVRDLPEAPDTPAESSASLYHGYTTQDLIDLLICFGLRTFNMSSPHTPLLPQPFSLILSSLWVFIQ